jgi:hypothetical protein
MRYPDLSRRMTIPVMSAGRALLFLLFWFRKKPGRDRSCWRGSHGLSGFLKGNGAGKNPESQSPAE